MECNVEPEQNDGLNPTSEAGAVHYNTWEDLQVQMERHIRLENEEAEWKVHEGKVEVEIDPKLKSHRHKLIEMNAEVESMWEGQLRYKGVENICIELEPGKSRPVPCAQYTVRPKAREFEKAALDKML